ncbi:MAG: nucleotidyltransferase domain-containing protein [Patescibacteria group bacterium]
MKISKQQRIAIRKVAEKNDLQLVLLFGSQVRGGVHAESDVDVAILPKKQLSGVRENTIAGNLMDILGDVDLTNLRTAGPLLMKQVFDNAQVLYEANGIIFDTYYVYAVRRYAEAKPLFDLTAYSIRKFAYGT